MFYLGIPVGVNDQLFAAGNDRFSVVGSGTTQLTITAIGPRQYFTLKEDFVEFLQTVSFVTDDQAASDGHRIEIVVQEHPLEATLPSHPALIQVGISPVNDRPVILSTLRSRANLTGYLPESINRGFSPSFLIDETNVDDIDLVSPSFIGFAITSYTDGASGNWMLWINGTWSPLVQVSECLPQLVPPDGRIRFAPSPNPSKADVEVSLVYRAWDGSSESIECSQDSPVFSEQSAVSAENETFTYYVEYLNRAPSIAQAQYSLPSIEEDEAYSSSVEVDAITGVLGSDEDDLYLGLAVTGADSKNGVWEYQSLGTWTEFPSELSSEWALLLDHNSQVRFLPNYNYFGMASFEALVWDLTESFTNTTLSDPFTGAFSTEPVTVTISVDSINDRPFVEVGVMAVNYTEGGPAVQIFKDLSISDEDSSELAWALVVLMCPLCTEERDAGSTTSLFSATTDTMLTSHPPPPNFNATVEYSDSTQIVLRVLAVEGADNSPAEFSNYLGSLHYRSTNDEPSSAPRVVTLVVSDGLNESDPVSVTIAIILINDEPPSLTLPQTSITWTEDSGPLQIFPLPVRIIDRDDNTLFPLAWAKLELRGHHPDFEYLAINCSLVPLACSYGNSTLIVSGEQSIELYEQALSEVYYINLNPEPAAHARQVYISVSDGRFSSHTAQLVIEVYLINDQLPVIHLVQQEVIFQEPDTNPITTSVRVAPNLTITDSDSGIFRLHSATLIILDPLNGESEGLRLPSPPVNVTGQYRHSLTLYQEEGVPLIILQDALRQVEYFNSAEQQYNTNRTIRITVADALTFDGVQSSDPVEVEVVFILVDDLPEVRLPDNILLYRESQSPQQLPVALTADIVDVDSSLLSGLDISLSANSSIDTSQERLQVNLAGFESLITQGPSGTSILLVGEASVTDYIAVLRSLTYQHSDTGGDPDTGLRTITATPYSTQGEPGIADTVVVAFSAVNNAPVVDLNGAQPGLDNTVHFTEESPHPVVLTGAGPTITDVDSEELVYMRIVLLNPLDGEMEYIAIDSAGLYESFVNSSTIELGLDSSPIAQYVAVLSSLVYINLADEPNTVTRTVSVEVSDGELSGSAEVKIIFTQRNDAPEIMLNRTELQYVEGGTVEIATGAQVIDPDSHIVGYRVRPDQTFSGDLISGPYLAYVEDMGVYAATFNNSTPPQLAAEMIGEVTFTNIDSEPVASDRVFCISVQDIELATSPEVCIRVAVQVVNDNQPMFEEIQYQAAVMENEVNTFVAQVRATDADSFNSNVSLTYSIVSGDDCSGVDLTGSGATGPLVPQVEPACRFQIDLVTGEVTTTSAAPDREQRDLYRLTVTVSDGELSSEAEIIVVIEDENDNVPVFVPDYYEVAIPVDAEEGYRVAQLMVDDPDLDSDFSLILLSMVPNIGRDVFILDPNDPSTIILNRPESELSESVDQYTLTFEALDSAFPFFMSPNMATVVVNITQNKQPPVFSMDLYTATVSESAPNGYEVLVVDAMDSDPGYHGIFSYSILESDVPFTINVQTGTVSVSDSSEIDFEALSEYMFTVVATDSGRPQMSSVVEVQVEVVNTNDNAPVFDSNSYIVEVCEGAPIGYEILELSVVDADGDRLSYDLVAMSGCSRCVAINSSTGTLTVAQELDFEDERTISLSVVVNDLLFFTDEVVTVHILNDNEASPKFSFQSLTIEIPETQEPGSFLPFPVANIPLASDTDACNIDHCDGTSIISNTTCDAENRLYYEITMDNEEGLFAIDRTLGLVSVSRALDVDMGIQQEFNLTLSVTDGQFTDTAFLIIIVTDINDNLPEFENESYSVTVREDIPVGTTIITTLATDLDPTDILQYSLVDEENPGYFNISDSGEVFVVEPLDFETIARYSLIVVVTDRPYIANATAVLALLSVYVSDVNDNAPTFPLPELTLYVLENSSPLGPIGSVQATDVDPANATVYYSISSSVPNDGAFIIDALSGQIRTTRPLDHETVDSYDITITAVDNGSPPLSANISVRVVVLNENESPPQISDNVPSTSSISESARVGTVILTLSAFDADYDSVGFRILGSDNETFALQHPHTHSEGSGFSMEDELANAPYTQYNIDLTLVRPLDYELMSEYDIVVEAFDIPSTAESMSLSSLFDIKVIVTDENDNPPVFSQTTYTAQIPELSDTGTFVVQLLATDADSGNNAVIQYGIEDGQSLYRLDNITGIITVDDSELLNIDLLGETHTLTLYAYNTEPPHHRVMATLLVNLLDVNNNAPYFETRDIVLAIAEDFTPVVANVGSSDGLLPPSFGGSGEPLRLVATLTAVDADQGINAELRYSLVTGSDLFFIDSLSGDLFVLATLDREQQDEYVIDVHVTDIGTPPLENSTSVLIRVTDINDNPPVFLEVGYFGLVLENTTIGVDILPLSASDADIGVNADIVFSIVDQGNTLPFKVDQQSRIIQTTEALDREAQDSYAFQVEARSGNLSSLTDVVITVEGINEFHPVISPSSLYTNLTENVASGTVIQRFTVFDADSGVGENSTISLKPSTGLFLIDDDGILTVTGRINYEMIQNISLEVIVRNLAIPHFETIANVFINVINLNDNPPVLDHSVSSVLYDELIQRQVRLGVGITITDADGSEATRITNGTVKFENEYIEPSFAYQPVTEGDISPIFGCSLEVSKLLKYSPCGIPDVTVLSRHAEGVLQLQGGLQVGVNVVSDSIVFDASQQQYAIYIGNVGTLETTGLTISMWAWFEPTASDEPVAILSKISSSHLLYGIFCTSNGSLMFSFSSAGLEQQAVFSGGCSALEGAWHHLALVVDNSNPQQWSLNIFIDGIEFGSADIVQPFDSTGGFFLGASRANLNSLTANFFNGRLHMLVVSLSSSDLNSLNCVIGCGLVLISLDYSPLTHYYDYSQRALFVEESQPTDDSLAKRAVSVPEGQPTDVYEDFFDSLAIVLPFTEPRVSQYTLSYTVHDGLSNSLQTLINVILVPSNDFQPELSLNGALSRDYYTLYVEEGGPVAIVNRTSFYLTDMDLIEFNYVVTASIVEPLQPSSEELLAVQNVPQGMNVSYTNHTLTLTGLLPLPLFEVVVRTLTYKNTADEPTGSMREIIISILDPPKPSTSAQTTVQFVSVNDRPAILLVSSQTEYREGDGAVLILESVAFDDSDDPYLSSAVVSLTPLDPGMEFLSTDTTNTNITAAYDPTTATLSLSGIDSQDNYAAVLVSIRYEHIGMASPSLGTRVFTFVVSDGEAESHPQTLSLFFAAVNDAPVINLSGGANLNYRVDFEEDTDVVISIVANNATIIDIDGDSLAWLSVQIIDPERDESIVVPTPAVSSVQVTQINASYVQLTPTSGGSAPLSDYVTVLRTVQYQNTAEEPRPGQHIVEFVASDGLDPSAPALSEVIVIAANDRPVLDLDIETPGTGYVTEVFEEGGSPVNITGRSIALYDNDAADSVDVIMIVIQLVEDGLDEMIISTDPSTVLPPPANGQSVTYIISAAQLEIDPIAFLASLQYYNARMEPTPGMRTISVAVSDGVEFSNTALIQLSVMGVNENAPEFTMSSYAFMIQEALSPPSPVGSVTAIDIDDGVDGDISYEIAASIPLEGLSHFTIDGTTGLISTAVELDWEGIPFYELTILARDEGIPQHTANATVFVEVGDINDNSPMFYPGTDSVEISIPETASLGEVVETVEVVDPDDGVDIISLTLVNMADVPFTLGIATHEIAVSGDLDVDTQSPDGCTNGGVTYDLVLQATDFQPPYPSSTAVISIHVEDVNDNAPQFVSNSSFAIFENDESLYLFTVTAVDRDCGSNGEITYSFQDSSTYGLFNISESTGAVTSLRPLDREQRDSYNFTVVATDGGMPRQSSSISITLQVLDINDNAPLFEQEVYELAVREDMEARVTVSARDIDAGASGLIGFYSLDPQTLPADPLTNISFFTIDPFRGSITFNGADVESQVEFESSYTLTVYAVDAGTPSLTGSGTVIVYVSDVNDNAPLVTTASSHGEVPENVAEFTIATFSATDADSAENGDVSFGLLYNSDAFVIDPLTGVLTTVQPLDFEDECYFAFYVFATDNGSTPLTSPLYLFEVFVQPIEDIRPEFIDATGQLTSLYLVSTPENNLPGTIVTQLTATDRDMSECEGEVVSGFGSGLGPGAPVSYSLNESSTGFEIDQTTGEIRILRSLDYEEAQRHVLTVLATDLADLQAQATVVVNVLDRNDHTPQFLQPFYEATVPENTAIGSSVLQVLATDEDSLDQGRLVYSLTDSSPYFDVERSSGTVFVNGDIDFESAGGDVILSVSVVDSAGNRATVPVTITIADTNDLPPIINTQPETLLFTEGQISLQPFSSIDISDSDSFQHLCNASVFLYSPEPTPADSLDQCTCTDTTSAATCSPDCLEFIQLSPDSFPGTVVQRQGGFELELIGNLSIEEYERALEKIVYINVIFDPAPQPRAVSLTVFDCQLPSNTLVQSIDIQPLNLVAPSLDLNGEDPGINYQTTFTERGNGVAIVSENVTITDEDMATSVKILTGIDVRLTNEQDTLESIHITHIPIGASIATNSTHITISGVASLTEYANALMSAYYINLNNEPSPVTRVVEFVAHEYSLSSSPAYTEIAISTINDFPPSVIANPPHVNYITTYMEGTPGASIVASDALIVDEDSTNDNVTEMQVYVLGPEASDRLSIDGYIPPSITYEQPTTYSLSFTGSASRSSYEGILRRIQYQHTADEFTSLFPPKVVFIQIADHSLSGFTVIQIELTPVNDHLPVFTEESLTLAVSENTTMGTSLYQLQVTDQDTFSTTEVNFTIIGGGGSEFFSVAPDTGVITLSASLDHEADQELSFTVEVTDEGAVTTSPSPAVASVVITVIVTDQNDHVPMFTQPAYNATIDEGAPIGTSVLQLSANDRDSPIHSVLEFSVVNTTAFTVDISGTLYTNTHLDQESVGSYQFVVSVRNPGDMAMDTADVFITVTDINDHPPRITLSPESATLLEPVTLTLLSLSLTISDGDSNPSLDYAIVEILGGVPGNLLAISSLPGITVAGNGSKSIVFIGASQSLANYERILRDVVYEDTSEEPLIISREIAYQVGSDPGPIVALNYSESETLSNVAVFQVSVEGVNDQPPVIQLDTRTPGASPGCSYSANYTEDSSPVRLSDGSLSISDADSGNTTLNWATVELLQPTGGDSLHYSGTLEVNRTATRLVLQGPASIAEFEAALRTVSYQTTSQDPTGVRQALFTVNDGVFTSAPALACVQLFKVNDAPVLTLGPAGSVDTIVMYREGQAEGLVLAPQLDITGKLFMHVL